jgi:zinc transporter 1/2/3
MGFNKLAFKWASAAVIWITTLAGSILPMWITTLKWTSRLEALAGGVFLGAGLAHLLADSFEDIGELSEYPTAPAVALGTFVILTAVELFSYGEHDEEFQVGEEAHHHHSAQFESIPDKTALLQSGGSEANSQAEVQLFGTKACSLTVPTTSLYIIMDVHSVIEGLALGILSREGALIAIFCAIVGHKPVEAFALSLIILKDKPTKLLFWILVIFYTLMSPIGLISGIYITKETENPWVTGVIAAFSAGTFLFVGCHEWSELFEHKSEWSCSEKSWHFGMFTVGVVWMLLIAIVEAVSPKGGN